MNTALLQGPAAESRVSAEWRDIAACDARFLDEWAKLAAADAAGSFFAGPDFAHAFAETFAGRAKCEVLAFRSGTRLVGVVPMMRCRVRRGARLAVRHDYMAGDAGFLARPGFRFMPLRQISPLLGLEASVMSTHLAVAPGWEAAVWRSIPAALARAGGWDTAVLPVAEPGLAALVAAAREAGLGCRVTRMDRPMQALDPVRTSDDLIAAQNKKFRQNMRRAARFAEEAAVTLSLLQDADARAALGDFAALAGQSWKADTGSTRARGEALVVPYAGRQADLAARLAGAPGLRPVLAAASGPDGLRAACLAFQTPVALTPFVMVQDAAAGRESLGHLVLHRLIDHADAAGLTRLDYNANSGWLESYVNRVEVIQGLTLFPPGLRGRLLGGLAGLTGRSGG